MNRVYSIAIYDTPSDKIRSGMIGLMVDLHFKQGHPPRIAALFGVDERIVSYHLSRSRRISGIRSHHEMGILLHHLLGIDKWGWLYQEILAEQVYDDNWHHLVFARQMTVIEWEWYKNSKISPPLWLSE